MCTSVWYVFRMQSVDHAKRCTNTGLHSHTHTLTKYTSAYKAESDGLEQIRTQIHCNIKPDHASSIIRTTFYISFASTTCFMLGASTRVPIIIIAYCVLAHIRRTQSIQLLIVLHTRSIIPMCVVWAGNPDIGERTPPTTTGK